MKRRAVPYLMRFGLGLVVTAPILIGLGYLMSAKDGSIPWDRFRRLVAEIDGGIVSEEAVLTMCVVVMVVSWSRVVWVSVSVAVCVWRGREPTNVDRPLTRLVLRILMLAPVALNSMSSRAQAVSPIEFVEVARSLDTGSESRQDFSQEMLLVSIVVAVGVSWRLHRKRNAALRSESPDALDPVAHEFESDVMRHGHDVALSRLDLAVRSLLAGGHTGFRWLIQHPTGLIHVEGSTNTANCAPWTRISDRMLVLDTELSLAELSRYSGDPNVRIPVLVPVGVTRAGAVWLNLETAGAFFVDGRDTRADEVWDGLCQSLSLSPLHTSVNLISSVDNNLLGARQVVASDHGGAQRVANVLHCPESPSVLLVDKSSRRVICLPAANTADPVECGLVSRQGSWYLLPMEHPILPTACGEHERTTISQLVGGDVTPLRCPESLGSHNDTVNRPERTIRLHRTVQSLLTDVSFVVRVMGRPSVDHVEHGEVSFERSRSEELVLWLALHPERRRRSAARAEMWNTPVKDSTFSNITSDVRRTLTAFELPPEGDQWLSVTLNEDLPLHPRIVTDVGLLDKCLEHVRRYPEDGGQDVLMSALEWVRGCPFDGSRYLWRDGTGIATDIAMLIVRAALLCAELALEAGDTETVYRSTAKGLCAVPGHEGLVSIRMRQHAESGDRASLVAEWESYCRSLMTDDWGDARPSQKMIELWLSLSLNNR
ncbi:MAG: hypothetical protein ACKOI2_10160 [Actinomycetota bacterium]